MESRTSTEKMTVLKAVGVVIVVTATFSTTMLWRHGQGVVSLRRRSTSDEDGNRIMQSFGYGPLVAMVTVNTKETVAIVDERFVSVGATMGSINKTLGETINATRFRTVARGLAPAIYRLGGAEADFTYFHNDDEPDTHHGHELGRLHFSDLILHSDTWDNLNEFVRDVGWEILFSLNALQRNGTEWDPANSVELLKYSKRRGHRVLWALGNEPNGYSRKANVTIPGAEMANAFHTLRDIMDHDLDMEGAFVVGPDVSSPKKYIPKSGESLTGTEVYLDDFLQNAGNTTNVTSFHFYYTNGRVAGFFNITDPVLADILKVNIEIIRNSVNKYRPQAPKIWITESGVTYGQSTEGISVNFDVGFLTLDKLGVCARYGVDLIAQKTLAGKFGGLLDSTYSPRLQYWLLLYHKRLMGTRVLDVSKVVTGKRVNTLRGSSMNFTNYVRIYAHCTKTSGMYSPGSVTLMIINMVPIEEVRVNVEGSLSKGDSYVHEYLFTPLGAQGLLSRNALLSGQRLRMTNDHTLPYHKPRRLAARSPIVIPPQTYGFYVIPDAAAPACLPAT